MYMRKDVSFKGSGDVPLHGWLYHPVGIAGSAPCIIMTHGFSALKEHSLHEFAAYFATHQKAVLVYDNRHFGASGGMPRQEVNPNEQADDIKAAISYVQQLSEVVDRNRIGLWGTSFSAGIHITVAAEDRRVKCIVAQVPHVVGFHRRMAEDALAQMRGRYEAERSSQQNGNAPRMLRVVSRDLDGKAIMKGEQAYQVFTAVPAWQNQVTFSSLELTGDYSPIDVIDKIAPTPLLMIVATHDTVNDAALALKAFEKALPPKKCLMVEGDHFAPYKEAFTQCVESANAWYDEWLA